MRLHFGMNGKIALKLGSTKETQAMSGTFNDLFSLFLI